jgi:ATP-binding cassette, subfamily B (MDR/TAP), member 1
VGVGVDVGVGMYPVGRLATISPNVGAAAVAAEDIFAIIDRVPAIDTLAEVGAELPEVEGRLEFDTVQFAYPLRPTVTVLNDATIQVPAGATVALVGQSGCGKSTVIQLLERFYDPRSGVVRLDGVDVRTLNPHWLRRQIGLVQQEPILFARSIRENIRYGSDDASDDAMYEAARRANIHTFIMSLPDQYDTFVGERGAQVRAWVGARRRPRADTDTYPHTCVHMRMRGYSCRAGKSSVLPLHGRFCGIRGSCCWTRPRRRWTARASS